MKNLLLPIIVMLGALSGAPADLIQGDFNGDGRVDFVYVDESTRLLAVTIDGRSDWSLPGTGRADSPPAVADIDANGTDDIAYTDFRANRVVLLQGQRDGSFLPSEFPLPGPLAVGWVEADTGGALELVTLASAGEDSPSLVRIDQHGNQERLHDVALEAGTFSGFRAHQLDGRLIFTGIVHPVAGSGDSPARLIAVDSTAPDFSAVPLDYPYTVGTEIAMFGGSPFTVLWDPGHDDVLPALLLPAICTPREAARVSKPVSQVVVVPGVPNDRLLAIAEDGASAEWIDDVAGNLVVGETLLPPQGVRFAAASAFADGSIRFLARDGSGRITRQLTYSADGRLAERVQLDLPAFRQPKTTVAAYTENPLLHSGAYEMERFARGQWATSAKTAAGAIEARVETFGGSSAGLGGGQTVSFHPAGAFEGVLANQFEQDSSLTFEAPAGFSGIAAVRVHPEPGTYGATVGMSFEKDLATTVRYRIEGGAWQTWSGDKIFLTKDAMVDYYGEHSSGLLSGMGQAVYLIEQSLGLADANKDGLPDSVAAAFSLDPFGKRDTDGDTFSDLDEILAGTDPRSGDEFPAESTLTAKANFRIMNASSSGALLGTTGGFVHLVRLDGSHIASGPVDDAGMAAVDLPFGALNGLGLAIYENTAAEGVAIAMAAGIAGVDRLPPLDADTPAAWVTQARAEAARMREMETVEISPRSTLAVIAFEKWLGETLAAVGRISAPAEGPSILPPSAEAAVLLPDLGVDTLLVGNAAFALGRAMEQARALVESVSIPAWDAILERIYTSPGDAPLGVMRRLFLEGDVPVAFAGGLPVSLQVLTAETAVLSRFATGETPVVLSGSLERADANCLVLITAEGSSWALVDDEGTPYWPFLGTLAGGSATVTGLPAERTLPCAEHALTVISLAAVAPAFTPAVVDTDGDTVDDGYEEAFHGTLTYGADDDPDGDGLTLGQAYHAGLPPNSGGVPMPGPAFLTDLVIRSGETPHEIVLSWTAEPGRAFRVSRSANLRDWSAAFGQVEETGPGAYQWISAPQATPDRHRFYRVLEE